MSNSWFQFKQFAVHQERCAMKVSTDACIQGAWTPVNPLVKSVLDIGAGTGLLSLMVAQRMPVGTIDAVEQNADAALQAAENVAASPFSSSIHVRQGDATALPVEELYDLIICNPPFFRDSLTGPDAARNIARHSGVLNQESLLEILLANLSASGVGSVMWPPKEHESFIQLAANQKIFLYAELLIRDKARSAVTRVVGLYSRNSCANPEREMLTIKMDNGSYTQAFATLLSPFYLHL